MEKTNEKNTQNFDYIIATDSGCDLSLKKLQNLNVVPLFMHYTINDEIFTDDMNEENLKIFYDKMKNGDCPKTSSINTQDFYDFFKDLLKQGLPILYISLGSGISGTYDNAVFAANQLREENENNVIYVLDSTCACAGYGLMVVKASELRKNGASFEECFLEIESMKHKVSPFYTTDDLTYLYRGGRVKKGKMIIAHALNIRPILDLDYDGRLRVCDKARGEKNTYDKIVEKIKNKVIDPENQILYISHSFCEKKARVFADYIRSQVPFKNYYITNIGPIIGSHTGPGLVAAFIVGKDRDA